MHKFELTTDEAEWLGALLGHTDGCVLKDLHLQRYDLPNYEKKYAALDIRTVSFETAAKKYKDMLLPTVLRKITVDGVTATLWSDGSLDIPWSVADDIVAAEDGECNADRLTFEGDGFCYCGEPLKQCLKKQNVPGLRVKGGRPCSRRSQP